MENLTEAKIIELTKNAEKRLISAIIRDFFEEFEAKIFSVNQSENLGKRNIKILLKIGKFQISILEKLDKVLYINGYKIYPNLKEIQFEFHQNKLLEISFDYIGKE